MSSFGTLARAPTPAISPGEGRAKVTDSVEVDLVDDDEDDIVFEFAVVFFDVDLVAVWW